MKQYEFKLFNKKTGGVRSVRATAANQITAFFCILEDYGHNWDVSAFPVAVRPAHKVLGEIDCTAVTQQDINQYACKRGADKTAAGLSA